jgi:hypothetical protein
VISVSELNNLPPLGSKQKGDTIIPGKATKRRWQTRIDECSEGYLKRSGSLLRGRFLSEDDEAQRDTLR